MSMCISINDAYNLGHSEGYIATMAGLGCSPQDDAYTFTSYDAWNQYIDGWYAGVWDALAASASAALDSDPND